MNRQAASTHLDPISVELERPAPIVDIALDLFESLAPLHDLDQRDAFLLTLAADLLQAASDDEDPSEVLVRAAVAMLPRTEERIVDAVYDLSQHMLGYDARVVWTLLSSADRHRILWLTGILRLAAAAASEFGRNAEGVHAAWTDILLHLEFDGARVHEDGLTRVSNRTAALEVVSGRRVLLTSSYARRGRVA